MLDKSPSNEDVLAALREFQDSAKPQGPNSFAEWRQDFAKAGGHISPGFGMMGPPGNTASRAPAGPRGRPSGEQMVGWNGSAAGFPQGSGLRGRPNKQPYDKPYSTEPWFGNPQFGVNAGIEGSQPSKYNFQRPNQPPPWIDDVDMASIWYSPFEPVWPFGPPFYTRPREWDFPVGYNLNYIPQRLESMNMLRGMRQSWGVLAAIIETRKDQLLRLPWTIQLRDKPRASSKAVDAVRQFFRRPDGKLTYSQWSRKLLDDLFVLDAPTLYMNRNLGGQLKNVEVLDGGTIFPLIDDAGRRPDTTLIHDPSGIVYEHRQPAFQQIIYGLPMINLSEDEIIYAMMRPRPELPVFGYSPVEQILIEATEAIRKTFYQLEFWRAGSMPELIVTVPDNWTPRQIAAFQGHFDALLSGQLTLKSKVRFVPGGMKPFDIKNASGESLWSERDEMLIRLACYAFSVSPTPFVKQTNRATASNAQTTAQEEGLYPLMSWWKDDVMDTIIQEKLGLSDIEFVFLPRPEPDQVKQSQIHQVQVREGIRTINEVREELGLEPVDDGNSLLIYTGTGAVRLDQVIAGDVAMPGAPAPAGGTVPRPASQSGASQVPLRGPVRPREASPIPPTSVHKAGTIADAAEDAERHPTHLQRKIGNYKKGHIWLNGLNITIENAKGSKRGEKDKFGRGWKVKMPAAYGYIRGTVGADDMQVDCYLGKHEASPLVFVIDQDKFTVGGSDKGFDETKVMLGYKTLKRALKDYLASHFDGQGHERLAAVTQMSYAELKSWLAKGDMKKPASESGFGTVLAHRGDPLLEGFAKSIASATISQATGLLSYDQRSAAPRKRKSKRKSKVRRRQNRRGPRWLELQP